VPQCHSSPSTPGPPGPRTHGAGKSSPFRSSNSSAESTVCRRTPLGVTSKVVFVHLGVRQNHCASSWRLRACCWITTHIYIERDSCNNRNRSEEQNPNTVITTEFNLYGYTWIIIISIIRKNTVIFLFQPHEVPLWINPARVSEWIIQHLETFSSIHWIRTGQETVDFEQSYRMVPPSYKLVHNPH
jgi:hypothetical protein